MIANLSILRAGVGVVRGHVEALAHAALRIHRQARIARVHHRRDARDLGAERQHLQVEHDLEVLVERLGHADRRFGQLRGRSGTACRPFECGARSRERRPDTRSGATRSAGRQIAAQRRDLVHAPNRAGCGSVCWRAARSASLLPSPNSFSNTTCGLFSIGSGVVGVLPGDRVRVSAGVARAAAEGHVFDRKLERRQRRVLADLPRRDLIDRRRRRGSVLLRLRAAQEHRGRARVIGAGVGSHAACRSRAPGSRRS